MPGGGGAGWPTIGWPSLRLFFPSLAHLATLRSLSSQFTHSLCSAAGLAMVWLHLTSGKCNAAAPPPSLSPFPALQPVPDRVGPVRNDRSSFLPSHLLPLLSPNIFFALRSHLINCRLCVIIYLSSYFFKPIYSKDFPPSLQFRSLG